MGLNKDRIKRVAIETRRRLLKDLQAGFDDSEIRQKERNIANSLFENSIKPVFLDYIKFTYKQYSEFINHWAILMSSDHKSILIKTICMDYRKDIILSTAEVPGKQIDLSQYSLNVRVNILSRIRERFLNHEFKPLYNDKRLYNSRARVADTFFLFELNKIEPDSSYLIELPKAAAPVYRKIQRDQALSFARENLNEITNFINQAAELGAEYVNVVYNFASDTIKIKTSHTIKEGKTTTIDTFYSLQSHNASCRKLLAITDVMQYWTNYFNTEGLVTKLLPISLQVYPINYGIQIALYNHEDLQEYNETV